MVLSFRMKSVKAKKIVGPALGLMCVLALPACSFVEDRSERYVDAPERDPLKVPQGLDDDRLGQALAIRDVRPASAQRMFSSEIPKPPDMTAEILDENYVVEELDDQAWLLVNDVPGRVWPVVMAWMNERGLGVADDNAQLGLMQSEVVNFSKRARQLVELDSDANAGEAKVLVQARITPGVRRKTTEIQLRRRELSSADSGLLGWDDADRTEQQLALSKRLLADLGDFMRNRDDTKSYSRAALGMTSDPRVRLISENEQPVAIRLDLEYDRAWAELRRALAEAEVPVVDLDRSEGQFYVDFRSEDERKPGFFSWFADDPKPEYTFNVRLAERDGSLLVTAARAPDYDGSDRSSALLSKLFDYLY